MFRLLILGILSLLGLSKAECQQFVNFTEGKLVTTIVENSQGIWMGTQGGLVKYTPDFAQYTVYTRTNSDLPANHVSALCKGNNNDLWALFCYPFCLGHYSGQNWEVIPVPSSAFTVLNMIMNANCISADHLGNIWIGSGLGILKYDGNQFTCYDESNTSITDFIVRDIMIDSLNRIIAGSYHGLLIFDGQNWTEYTNQNSSYPFTMGVTSLAASANGTIWCASVLNGICKYDGSSFTAYTTTNSPLPGNLVQKLKMDAFGNLWVSCYENSVNGTQGGILKFDGTNWEIWDKNNTPFNKCNFSTLACMTDGSILVLNDSLYHFSNQQWIYRNTSGSLLPDNIVSELMVCPNNDIWVGSNGISRINGYSWYNYKPGATSVPCNYFQSSGFNPTSTAYFNFSCPNLSSGKRLWKYSDGQWGLFNYDTLTYSIVDFSCAPDGDLWWVSVLNGNYVIVHDSLGMISTFTGPPKISFLFDRIYVRDDSLVILFGHEEAWYLRNGQWTFESGATYPPGSFQEAKTGPDRSVYALFDLCSHKSLYRYSRTGWSPFTIEGYQGESISCFNWDSFARLWLGLSETGGGFSIFDGQNRQDFSLSTHPIPGGYYRNLVFDTLGNAWFAVSHGGLLVYNPDGVFLGTENEIIQKENSILCYPNPTDGLISIDFQTENSTEVIVTVFNTSGLKVFRTLTQGQNHVNLDLTFLPSGMYLLMVTDGIRNRTSKVIIR